MKSCLFITLIKTPFSDALFERGVVVTLIALLHQPHQPHHEHLADALVTMTSRITRARSQCCDPSNNLQQLLQKRVIDLKGKEQFEV